MDITVKELMDQFRKTILNCMFSSADWFFYRLKDRGGYLQIEFNQSVYLGSEGSIVN